MLLSHFIPVHSTIPYFSNCYDKIAYSNSITITIYNSFKKFKIVNMKLITLGVPVSLAFRSIFMW